MVSNNGTMLKNDDQVAGQKRSDTTNVERGRELPIPRAVKSYGVQEHSQLDSNQWQVGAMTTDASDELHIQGVQLPR